MAAAYQQNARTMLKIKHARTADVVLAGYRLHKTSTPERPLLGSMLLGLYDDGEAPARRRRGVASPKQRRAELIEELRPLECRHRGAPLGRVARMGDRQPRPGPRHPEPLEPGKDLSFTPLRPERVLEVGYEHMEGRRFRHTAQFKRWRPDRDPESCGYDQLEEPVSYDLTRVLDVDTEAKRGRS